MRYIISFLLILLYLPLYAGEHMSYKPLPNGSIGLIYYNHNVWSDSLLVGGDKVQGFSHNTSVHTLRTVYYDQFKNTRYTVQSIIPIANIEYTTPFGSDSMNGVLINPSFLVGTYLLDRPDSDFWIGVTQWITAPIGEYDSKNIININNNMWAFKTELGIYKKFNTLAIDYLISGTFYLDNKDYSDTISLSREELYLAELHFTYSVLPYLDFSLETFVEYGGKYHIKGKEVIGKAKNLGSQYSIGIFTSEQSQLLFQYRHYHKIENGFDDKSIIVRLLLFFN